MGDRTQRGFRRAVVGAGLALGVCAGLVMAGAALGGGAVAEELAAYRPVEQVAGTLRIWGSPADGRLIGQLEAGFRRYQPGVDFVEGLHGPESTFAGVYTGVADLALMARELRVPMESMAFEWVHHYKVFEVAVANAGFDAERPGVSLGIFVNVRNPLKRLTLGQLDGIFGARAGSGRRDLREWGEAGGGGSWSERPIHVYGPDVESVSALYIRDRVLHGSRKWNPGYRQVRGGWKEVLSAIARDPEGIAFAPAAGARRGVRCIALAVDERSPALMPTAATVAEGTYPLSRTVEMVLDREPGKPVEGREKEFLRYILSHEGQDVIARDRAYVPLSAAEARLQLARLETTTPVALPREAALLREAARPREEVAPSGPELRMPYVARESVSGTIRIWGHGSYDPSQDFIEALVRGWEDGFRRHQPGVRFENHLNGTAAAIGALYTGVGDLALMGREIWPPEVAAFREVMGYAPTGLDVVTGSFDVRNRGYAIVVFVHKDNPVSKLTLAQLDAVFGVERRRGGTPVRTWGDLGLSGEWRDQPIQLYGLPIARGFAEYFEDAVFKGGRVWKPELREFADQPGSKGGATDGGQRMLDAMAKDRYSIGYAGLVYHNSDVKPVALAVDSSGPFVAPSRESVLDHTYPLTRMITVYLNRAPGRAADPKLREFLSYVLSDEGQRAVLREGRGYLPMLSRFSRQELQKLEE